MNNEFINFDRISRENWKDLHQQSQALLTEKELESIKSLNDNINIQDVIDIYLPLINLIQIYKRSQENLSFSKAIFLKKENYQRPFIIGISGSVAVGKSTTSRLLQLLISRTFKDSHVELVTTDGFLYPNEKLIQNGILNRKGFPESYDMESLLNFLDTIKNGITAKIPIYSHEIYDIVPNQLQTIETPDFLILEGINVFQNQQNHRLLQLAEADPSNYYHKFTQIPPHKAMELAKDIWKTINLVNLEKYIEPTRNRADFIIHKGKHHKIDEIYLKK